MFELPGHRVVRCWAWASIVGLLGLFLGSGCAPKRTAYPDSLSSDRTDERITAIKHAGEIGDQSAIPVLIDRLEDDDQAVRLFAILSLEKLTGTRRGYVYHAPASQRHRAVLRWRQWLAETSNLDNPERTP